VAIILEVVSKQKTSCRETYGFFGTSWPESRWYIGVSFIIAKVFKCVPESGKIKINR